MFIVYLGPPEVYRTFKLNTEWTRWTFSLCVIDVNLVNLRWIQWIKVFNDCGQQTLVMWIWSSHLHTFWKYYVRSCNQLIGQTWNYFNIHCLLQFQSTNAGRKTLNFNVSISVFPFSWKNRWRHIQWARVLCPPLVETRILNRFPLTFFISKLEMMSVPKTGARLLL